MPLISKQNTNPAPRGLPDGGEPLAQLAGGDAAGRRAAAQALGARAAAAGAATPDARTAMQAVPALAAALPGEPDPAVRSAILDALASWAACGAEEAVSNLADCLRGEDVALRNAAIALLRGLPEQVAPVMAHLLVDWDRDVRILAVGILESLRHERVEEWLLQLIDADPDLNVCGVALDVLAEVATPAARMPVRRLLARFPDEPYIEFAGRLVLERVDAVPCEGAA